MSGEKIPLGFVETSTENERVCRQLIQDLIRRGLHYHEGLLAIDIGLHPFLELAVGTDTNKDGPPFQLYNFGLGVGPRGAEQ
jgi:hypothetical protein